jgi:hypothetical protein
MTHPEELLAGYVDGSLTRTERAQVDEHLASCATCRQEVELAGRAARLLAELPEEPVPIDVAGPVTSELRRMAAPRPARWRARVQWTAGLAAAAVIVAVLAVALPRRHGALGGGGAESAALPHATATAPGMGGAFVSVPLEASTIDYAKPGRLQALAQESASLVQKMPRTALSPTPKAADLTGAQTAAACLAQAAGGGITENDTLVRLIRARFGGQPAYLGVYLRSPGAGQPPDKVVIWVASRPGCRLLSFTSSRV